MSRNRVGGHPGGCSQPHARAAPIAPIAVLAATLLAPGAGLRAQDLIFAETFESGAPCTWSAVQGLDLGPICLGPYPIDFCRLQFPLVINATEGTEVVLYGRLYVAGLTDQSPGNDPAPEVLGWVGVGPDGSAPALSNDWVWTLGAPNPAYIGLEPNNDEYQATLTVPGPPGDYAFAFRFSGDSGGTFTYCDGGDAGSSDGYNYADAGQLTSLPRALFISEYVEGSSNNKALEVYNAGDAPVDLGACKLRFYFNGNVVPGTTIDLPALQLAPGGTHVVCDDEIADTGPCDQTSAAAFFNGDDAIELSCSDLPLDVIGQIGIDPGTEWSDSDVGTEDETLQRKCDVTSGDSDGSDPFSPSVEWSSFPQDTFIGLGQHCP